MYNAALHQRKLKNAQEPHIQVDDDYKDRKETFKTVAESKSKERSSFWYNLNSVKGEFAKSKLLNCCLNGI